MRENVNTREIKYVRKFTGYVLYLFNTPCSLNSNTVIGIPIKPAFASKNTMFTGTTVSIPSTCLPYFVASSPNAPPKTIVKMIGKTIIKNIETGSRNNDLNSILKNAYCSLIKCFPPVQKPQYNRNKYLLN